VVDSKLDAELLQLARSAAEAAADVLLTDRPDVLTTDTKSSAVDVVTQMDRRSENLIRDAVLRVRPLDSFLGEEGGASTGSSGVTWLVDPLDGTVNYLYDFPIWAVSIAAEVDGLTRVGVVVVPRLGQTFWATRDAGAFCNDRGAIRQLRVSNPVTLSQSLVATGFGYRRGRRAMQSRALVGVLPNVRDIRRAGAAAVDLCFVASGRVDAYFERGLSPWDVAAGALIATEAGAIVVPPDNSFASDALYFAAAPSIAVELADLLQRVGAYDLDLPDDVDV